MTLFLLIPWFFGFLVGFGEAEKQASLTEWTTAYSLEGEHQIVQNGLLTTLPHMTKEWKVTFDIKPTDFNVKGYANVLHMTIGGQGVGGGAKVGDRNPAIWFHKTRGVLVSSALDGKASVSKFFKNLPLAGEWTTIEVSQSLVSSQYMFSITIGNKKVFTKPNTKPVKLCDVKVYSGSPWYPAQKGSLKNLKIETKTPIERPASGCGERGGWSTAYFLREEHKITRNQLLATIPSLKKEWKVSFDFKADNFDGFRQIVHMTVGGKGAGSSAKYGDRTPAIWTHSSKGFLISSAVGGRYNYAKYFKALPGTCEWINIEVGQELIGSKTFFYISIGGRKVFHTKNSKPSEFENVQVFASSDWYSPVSGSIKNLLIQNKHDGRLIFSLTLILQCFPQGTDGSCLLYWAPSFTLPGEHLLTRSTLLTTLSTLTKEWKVSFEFNPKSYDYNGFAQILHMTIGGQKANIGDRTPALWIHKSRGVYISTTLNGKANVGKFFPTKKPPLNEWTTIEISQAKKGSKYIFSLAARGETLWTVTNTKPKQFSNVHVYGCSQWYVAQAGSIRRLRIETMMPAGESKPY